MKVFHQMHGKIFYYIPFLRHSQETSLVFRKQPSNYRLIIDFILHPVLNENTLTNNGLQKKNLKVKYFVIG